MIVGGQREVRTSTIIDYHGPFDLGLTYNSSKEVNVQGPLMFNVSNLLFSVHGSLGLSCCRPLVSSRPMVHCTCRIGEWVWGVSKLMGSQEWVAGRRQSVGAQLWPVACWLVLL